MDARVASGISRILKREGVVDSLPLIHAVWIAWVVRRKVEVICELGLALSFAWVVLPVVILAKIVVIPSSCGLKKERRRQSTTAKVRKAKLSQIDSPVVGIFGRLFDAGPTPL